MQEAEERRQACPFPMEEDQTDKDDRQGEAQQGGGPKDGERSVAEGRPLPYRLNAQATAPPMSSGNR